MKCVFCLYTGQSYEEKALYVMYGFSCCEECAPFVNSLYFDRTLRSQGLRHRPRR